MSDLAREFYRKMRDAATGRVSREEKRRNEQSKRQQTRPFEPGRDPISAADSISGVLSDFHWDGKLAEAEVFANWPDIVGEQNASSSHPEALNQGTLIVRCKSTAWATQLRLMQGQILQRLNESFPDAEVTEIRFIGPEAPSWKKGPRSIPGRGPRDTYG